MEWREFIRGMREHIRPKMEANLTEKEDNTRYFKPQPDITAYEVAYCLAYIGGLRSPKYGVSFSNAKWDALPAEIRRHFVDSSYDHLTDPPKSVQVGN